MRTAVLVTKTDHCLNEILWRAELDELPIEITSIIGNRDNCRGIAERAGIPFHEIHMDGRPRQPGFARIQQLLDRAGRGTRSCLRASCRSFPTTSAGTSPAASSTSTTLPARFHRCEPLPTGLRTRGETDRRHLPLCHCRTSMPDRSSSRKSTACSISTLRTTSSASAAMRADRPGQGNPLPRPRPHHHRRPPGDCFPGLSEIGSFTNPGHPPFFRPVQGEVVEWSMAPDSKSDVV